MLEEVQPGDPIDARRTVLCALVGARPEQERLPPAGHAPATLSLGLALLVHAALAAALVSRPADPIGARGTDVKAVSVEVAIVSASALESRAQAAQAAPTSTASVDLNEGNAPAAAAPGVMATDTEVLPPWSAADGAPLETLMAPPAEAHDSASPQEATAPRRMEDTETTAAPADTGRRKVDRAPTSQSQPPTSTASRAEDAGGASSRGTSGAAHDRRAAAAASPGAIRAFTRGVVEALGKSRPKAANGRSRGTAIVAFAVAEGGGLEFVRITQSSGHGTLDDAALSAVQGASFPTPPSGMTLGERTYEVPYHFR